VSSFRAVCFDVGGVLTQPIGPAFFANAEKAGVDVASVIPTFLRFSSEEDGDEPAHRLERGEITVEEFIGSLGEAGGAVRHLMHHESPYFVPASFEPHERMLGFVAEVHSRGLKTGLITNSIREWRPHWDRIIPHPENFDVILHSYEIGLRKPDQAMYRLAAERLEVPIADILYLDDFAANAVAARRAGMTVVDVDDHEKAIAEACSLLGW
jgi:putative hydrolase of the HAD superfamily